MSDTPSKPVNVGELKIQLNALITQIHLITNPGYGQLQPQMTELSRRKIQDLKELMESVMAQAGNNAPLMRRQLKLVKEELLKRGNPADPSVADLLAQHQATDVVNNFIALCEAELEPRTTVSTKTTQPVDYHKAAKTAYGRISKGQGQIPAENRETFLSAFRAALDDWGDTSAMEGHLRTIADVCEANADSLEKTPKLGQAVKDFSEAYRAFISPPEQAPGSPGSGEIIR